MLLTREFLNKSGKTLVLRVGNLLSPKKLESFASDKERTEYLRRKTFVLANRQDPMPPLLFPIPLGQAFGKSRLKAQQEPILMGTDPDLMEHEVAGLSQECLLDQQGDNEVYIADPTASLTWFGKSGACEKLRFARPAREPESQLTWTSSTAITCTCSSGTGPRARWWELIDSASQTEFCKTSASEASTQRRSSLITGRLSSRSILRLRWGGPSCGSNTNAATPRYSCSGEVSAPTRDEPALQDPVRAGEYQQRIPPNSHELIVDFLSQYCRAECLSRLVRARSPFRTRPVRRWENVLDGGMAWDIEELSTFIAESKPIKKACRCCSSSI